MDKIRKGLKKLGWWHMSFTALSIAFLTDTLFYYPEGWVTPALLTITWLQLCYEKLNREDG